MPATRRTARSVEAPAFPILAWNHLPPGQDIETFRRMKACGLTLAGFVSERDLDTVHRAGMQALVYDPLISHHDWRKLDEKAVRRGIAKAVARTVKHPAVYGYYIKDEPSAEEFEGLAIAVEEVRRRAPGKWPYVNLLPNYANERQLGSSSYDDHLDRFARVCKPSALSYDNYSLMEGGGLRSGYFLNLEQMRHAALRHRLPFWNIVLTVAHFTYRELTSADARFQAYTTLAYGGRGLSYFTFVAPQVGNYRLAPIDQFGNITPTYSHLQHVDLQIHQLTPTLLKLRSDSVYHFNHVPPGSRGPDNHSLLTDVGEANLLVGDFTHDDGSRYAMVVNKDLSNSTWCRFTYRRRPTRVEMVSPYTGKHTAFEGEHRVLAPGQGTLLRIV